MKRDSLFWSIVLFPFDYTNEIFAKFLRVPRIENVKLENDGNSITIIHTKGAHIINKQEVLDCNFSSDLGSPHHKKLNSDFHGGVIFLKPFIMFAILSGFMSMLISFFPHEYFQTTTLENFGNPNVDSRRIVYYPSILLLSFSLTILLDWFLCLLLKSYRIQSNIGYYERDVLNIKLNNNFIRIRTGKWKENLGFLNEYDLEFREPNTSFYRSIIKPSNTHLIIVIILFSIMVFFNYKTPFWFYNLPEKSPVGSQIMNKVFGDISESLKYWEYYASSDSWDNNSNQPIINYNANPFRAFYDGMVSGLIFPVLLLVVLIVILLIVVFAIVSLVLLVLGNGFWGVLAFVLFIVVMNQINVNWRLKKIIERILRFFNGDGEILFFILFLIPFFFIGEWGYNLGESMIGENYQYFSWSGSFVLILSTFLLVKKGFRKRENEIICPRCLGKGHVDEADIVRLNRTEYWAPGGPCAYCEGLGKVNSELLARVDPDDVYLTLSLSPEERERYRNNNK
jgi:hypothetical protein